MHKKFLLITLTFFSVLFLVFSSTNNVQANDFERLPILNVYDAKPIKVNSKDLVAVLANDSITIIDYDGQIIKNLNFDNHNLQFSFDKQENVYNNNVKLEVIPDIDNKGTNDLLIIITDFSSNYTNAIQVISYEDNKILWQMQPQMKSNDMCSISQKCSVGVEITDYQISNNKLYLSAGYLFQEIDLNTGKVLKEYQYKNNIWGFTFVSDLNNNGSKDIALAVQPEKVVFIDGKTFNFISDIKVAKTITSVIPNTNGKNKGEEIKLNVWDLIYLEDRNILVAACEDGYVYEIDLRTKKIIKETIIIDILNKLNIKEFYYTYSENNVSYKNKYNYKKIKLEKIKTIDSDTYSDYIVVYNSEASTTNEQNKLNYLTISSLSTKPDLSNNTFISTDGNLILEISVDYRKNDHYILKDLNTKKEFFNNIYANNAVKIVAFNNYLLTFERVGKLSLYLNDKKLFSLPTLRGENIDVLSDMLLVFDDIDYPQQITVYDKDNQKILSYYDSLRVIKQYEVINNKLYIVYQDFSGFNPVMRVFDIQSGKLLYDKNIKVSSIIKMNIYMLDDVNSDGICEILIEINVSSTNVQLYRFDFVNNQILDFYELTNLNFSKHDIAIIKDIDNDNHKDIVFFDFTRNKTAEVYIFGSNSPMVKKIIYFDFQFQTTQLKVDAIYDFDKDGYDDIILTDLTGYYLINIKLGRAYSLSTNPSKLYNSKKQSITTDIDNDGYLELIFLQDYNNSLVLEVYKYKDNNLKLVNSTSITNSGRAKFEFAIYDYNKDGFKDFITIATDEKNNLNLIIYNIVTNNVTFKPISRNKNVTSDVIKIEEIKYGSIIDIKEINGRNYFISSIEINKNEYNYYFIDTEDISIKYIFNNFSGIINNQFITFDNLGKVTMTKIYNYKDIIVKKKGLLGNIINVNFSKAFNNIGYVEFKINDQTFSNQQGDLFIRLSEGKHHVYYTIYTLDGNVYSYYDVYVINSNYILYPITIIIAGLTICGFLFTKKIINRKFYRM